MTARLVPARTPPPPPPDGAGGGPPSEGPPQETPEKGRQTPLRGKFTPEDLTMAELEEAELAIGLPMSKWDETPSEARLIRVLGFYALRHVQPDITEAEVAGMTAGELADVIELNTTTDPPLKPPAAP